MRSSRLLRAVCGLWLIAGAISCAAAAAPLTTLPVREVTIFKDGHAFVLHEGTAPVEADGTVRIDDLPAPVLGTFWPFSSDAGVTLAGVSAGRQRVERERTALSVRELLEANAGARVVIHDARDRSYPATIVGVPRRAADEVETLAGDSTPRLAETGDIILLRTDEGVRTVRFDAISEVTFVDPPRETTSFEELRDLLTLRLDFGNQPRPDAARVGMTYLQKGLRWIPHYRVTLLEDGAALVELQATLLNELTDLDDVTAHLVIGVPTFQFQETLDPLALGRTLDQLSIYFRNQPANASSHFDNSMMLQTQVSRMSEYRVQPAQPAGDGVAPELGGDDGDLYVFSLTGLTLRQGERMVTTVGRWTVGYEDMYRLRIPFAPPPELRQYFESQRQADLAALHHQPKVMHVARLKNSSTVPFTTAPALIVEAGRVLAQGMMTYTSVGSAVDLDITAAVNVPVACEDGETGRVPDAARFNGSTYQRINLEGSVAVTNYHDRPIRIEVERMLLGLADEAGQDGAITRPGLQGQQSVWSGGPGWPAWWSGYSWPNWWHRLNSVSRIRWTHEVPAGGKLELTYAWHYFWG